MNLRITIKAYPDENEFFEKVIAPYQQSTQLNYGYWNKDQPWINIVNGHYAPNSLAHTLLPPSIP